MLFFLHLKMQTSAFEELPLSALDEPSPPMTADVFFEQLFLLFLAMYHLCTTL